jgi:hypothetical protein
MHSTVPDDDNSYEEKLFISLNMFAVIEYNSSVECEKGTLKK